MTFEFLGRGIAFPFARRPGRPVAYSAGMEKIEQSIRLVLATAPGERLMRPGFGCGIHDLVGQPNTDALRGLVAGRVSDALGRWEPRIDLLDIRVAQHPRVPNRLDIDMDYRIREDNSVFNLVYPFFINDGVGYETSANGGPL